jgi:nucleoside-diphosphate-sugar epimerase
MRVVVIGATGHIGTWLVPRLVARGHEMIAISRGARHPYHASPEWDDVRHVMLDRAAAEADGAFGATVAALAPDAVIDLICFTVDSASHLVDALRDQVELFAHCGTLWVHGVPQSRPYDETAPRHPFGEYGMRKAEIEKFLLGESQRGFPATILHPGHITGPGWNPINPAGNLDVTIFERLASGKKVALPDDGLATLQHVHADDVAHAFELAIDHHDVARGESFHIAAREPVTMRSYAEQAAGWYDVEADLELLPWDVWKSTVSERDAAITLDHIKHSPCASIEKAQRVLSFEPRFTAVQAARNALAETPRPS